MQARLRHVEVEASVRNPLSLHVHLVAASDVLRQFTGPDMDKDTLSREQDKERDVATKVDLDGNKGTHYIH